MTQKIVDLSDLLSEDKHVKFRKDGATYRLPGDIPAELFLLIQQEAERQQEAVANGEQVSDGAIIAALSEQILELFRYGDPEMEQLPGEVTIPQLLGLIARVYGDEPAPEPGPEGSERPSKAGTRSTTVSQRKKSR